MRAFCDCRGYFDVGEHNVGGGSGDMGGGRSFSDRYVFKRGKGGDFEGSGEEWGRGGEVGFGTECSDGNGSVGVFAGCGRCVRCGRVVGGVIEGGGFTALVAPGVESALRFILVLLFGAGMVERAEVFRYSASSILRRFGWRRSHSPHGKRAHGWKMGSGGL